MTKIEALVARVEAHEAEGEKIRAAMEAAGIDAKQMKTIRRAKADADAAQKTLDALLAGGVIGAADAKALDHRSTAPAAEGETTGAK